MKTWTIPQVVVEAFRANEYVAGSCQQAFVADETAIKAVMADRQIDFNCEASGEGRPPSSGQSIFISSSNLTQWNIDQGLIGPYEAGVHIRADNATQAQQYVDQGLFDRYYSQSGMYYGVVNIYLFQYSKDWHPSSKFEGSIKFS